MTLCQDQLLQHWSHFIKSPTLFVFDANWLSSQAGNRRHVWEWEVMFFAGVVSCSHLEKQRKPFGESSGKSAAAGLVCCRWRENSAIAFYQHSWWCLVSKYPWRFLKIVKQKNSHNQFFLFNIWVELHYNVFMSCWWFINDERLVGRNGRLIKTFS